MMSKFLLFIVFFPQIRGKFLYNPDSSSFIVLRHIRFSTDDEQHRIRCPYNLNHLTLQLLNYSNANCFNLYTTSDNNACPTHQSPCQFQAKVVQLHCDRHSYSNSVDITYQCSYQSMGQTFSPPMISHSSNPEETISLFLVGGGFVITLWIFVCCIWFICCHDEDENDPFDSIDAIPNVRNHFSLHINPFETNHSSSLRTTQSV